MIPVIRSVQAREIFDSSGQPIPEPDVVLSDRDPVRFGGLGALRDAWQRFTERLGHHVRMAADDVFATHADAIRRGLADRIATAAVIKPNQIGTVSEAINAIAAAQEGGYRAIVSHWFGATEDTFVADLCVGTRPTLFKSGSLVRAERVAQYNQLLRIEKELGTDAKCGATTWAEERCRAQS